MSTPTGLVLEQQSACGAGAQSLLVDYVQLGTAYLVRALNDDGKLGAVTKAMLKAQASRLGRLKPSQIGHHESKYRLMRQLELVKSAGLTIKIPRSHTKDNDPYTEMLSRQANPEDDPLDCLDIASLVSHIHVDPKLLGEKRSVPLSLIHVLADLGIQRLEDILCKSRKSKPTIVDAAELKQRYGSMVNRKHQVALNRLTLLAHGGPLQAESGQDPMAHNSSASLPVEMRQVDVTLIEADFKRHKRPDSTSCKGDWQPDSSQTATQLISNALRTAFGRPAPAKKITLNMTGSCRRKSKTKRRLTQQLYRPRQVLEADDALPASQKPSSKRSRQARASARRPPASCSYVAHSDDLEAFLEKFAYPQSMDIDSPTEIHMIPAFDKIGTASDQQSISDFAIWRRSHRPAAHVLHSNAKSVKHKIFIDHEEDPGTFTAPQRARHPTATMHELESLYGPQQLISNVFHKRQICAQEQFLVRWAPTFMLKHHIDLYRKALYETDAVQEIKGYLHHNAPALCLVSWKDSWEPGETIRQLQHLDGDVLSIDQRALSSVTRRLWAEPKDLQLPNLDAGRAFKEHNVAQQQTPSTWSHFCTVMSPSRQATP